MKEKGPPRPRPEPRTRQEMAPFPDTAVKPTRPLPEPPARMTADEFRKILDRFHQGLKDALRWKNDNVGLKGTEPWWHEELDAVWRDLNRECALMKDAERPCLACECGSPGGLPRDDDVAVFPSAAEVNAEQIGELQARVSQLEGDVTFLKRMLSALQDIMLKMQESKAKSNLSTQPHEDSGLRCLAGHDDGHGNAQPQCVQCKRCGEYIRPELMMQECAGKPPAKRSDDGASGDPDCWIGGKPPVADETIVVDTGLATATDEKGTSE